MADDAKGPMMSDQTCTYCGTTIPSGRSMCPGCNRLVPARSATAEAMPEDQLPPGMTDEAPPAVYGRAGEHGYVPPTAHRLRIREPEARSLRTLALWTAFGGTLLVGAVVLIVYLLS
jgi:hypothetical protein